MKRTPFVLLAILLLAAFAIRLFQLDAQPLSGDEAFTITQWGPASLDTLFNSIARIDPQPPVALLTYHSWIAIAGSSEFAVRLLSTFFSLLAVAGTYSLARRVLPQQGAILASFLCGIAAYQVWYAQDARTYSEWMAFSVLAAGAFARALPSNRTRPWLKYSILAALSLQVFYLELFAFAASNLYALYKFTRTKKLNKAWLISQAIVLITFVPWLLYSKPQDSKYQPTASFPDIPATLSELIFNNTLPQWLTSLVAPGLGITIIQILTIGLVAAAIYLVLRSALPDQKYLLLAQIVMPIILITALSLITHKAFFRTRYIASASIPLIILIAAVPFAFNDNRKRLVTLYSVMMLILPISLISLATYRLDPQFAKAPPWREIAKILAHDAQPHDIVIQNYPDPAFTYYYNGLAPTVILPARENPPAATTIAALGQIPAEHEHIWFVRVDTPYWDKDEVVAHWLEGNTAYLADQWVGGLRLYQYASWETTSDKIQTPTNVDMGISTLRGYRLTQSLATADTPARITVELFWQPKQTTQSDLRIFVHIITNAQDGSVQLIAQDDHPPQQGRHPTSTWPTDGRILRDIYQIPLPTNLPTGSYKLTIGFYDPTTLSRLTIPNNPNPPEPNASLITTITLPSPKQK